MSVTETTSKVTVDREAIVDALAHFEAAHTLLIELNDNVDTKMGEPFGEAMSGLWLAAFGDPPEGDEEYETDPICVEVYARGAEIAADALKASIAELEPVIVARIQMASDLPERIRALRTSAKRMRESGTIALWRKGGDDA